jgi:hypothetical protein
MQKRSKWRNIPIIMKEILEKVLIEKTARSEDDIVESFTVQNDFSSWNS